jgi:hypothetical protein
MSNPMPSTPAAQPGSAGFFVMRTPLLPFDTLLAFGQDLEGRAALADRASLSAALRRDREKLRQRLRALLDDPVLQEALFLASPAVHKLLPLWARNPEGDRGQKIERTILRYLFRMAGRPTPFGLFAACSTGQAGARTEFRLAGPAGDHRHTRLDADYLSRLVEALTALPPGLRRKYGLPGSHATAGPGGRQKGRSGRGAGHRWGRRRQPGRGAGLSR